MEFLTELFNHYGYIVLFVALMLELIAFPTPGETLMTYCGFLVYQGKLNWGLSISFATSGVILGITISYFIGRTLGFSFFQKYGFYIHLGPEKLDKISQWFKRYGNGLLMIAYFIPGVRHITGYFSGIARIPFRKFVINAYLGALIWTSIFISLGKALGSNWEKFHGAIKKYLIIAGVFIACVLLIVYLYRKYKQVMIKFVIDALENCISVFNSLGKIKAFIMGTGVIFFVLIIVLIGLVQDFYAHEFSQFDKVGSYLVTLIFPENSSFVMKQFYITTELKFIISMAFLLFMWIIFKGRNRILETLFLIVIIFGGGLLEEGLRLIFHRVGPGGDISTFPSRQTFLTVAVYGFTSFMIMRHAKNRWLGTFSFIITFVICVFTGLGLIYFQDQYPSDILGGYIFGGVWLSLNILLMEVYRVLPKIQGAPKEY